MGPSYQARRRAQVLRQGDAKRRGISADWPADTTGARDRLRAARPLARAMPGAAGTVAWGRREPLGGSHK